MKVEVRVEVMTEEVRLVPPLALKVVSATSTNEDRTTEPKLAAMTRHALRRGGGCGVRVRGARARRARARHVGRAGARAWPQRARRRCLRRA